MLDQYIIVGRQAEHGSVNYLHGDGSICKSAEKDGHEGTPLTVEYIGELMVELSESGPLDPDSAKYKQAVEHIRACLRVGVPNGVHASDEDMDAILDNAEIKLAWDVREQSDGAPDRNTRTLVVPVPDTLAHRRAALNGVAKAPGFNPPLTYTLDKILMQVYFAAEAQRIVDGLKDENGNDLSDALKDAIAEQFAGMIGSIDDQEANADDPAKKKAAGVLKDPVAAFHRAVGIYLTNMCD